MYNMQNLSSFRLRDVKLKKTSNLFSKFLMLIGIINKILFLDSTDKHECGRQVSGMNDVSWTQVQAPRVVSVATCQSTTCFFSQSMLPGPMRKGPLKTHSFVLSTHLFIHLFNSIALKIIITSSFLHTHTHIYLKISKLQESIIIFKFYKYVNKSLS